MDNPFQSVRDEAMVRFTHKGEAAARDYIVSLSDPDLRDTARVHLAEFLAAASVATFDNCDKALELIAEVENLEGRLDALLELARLLNSHHRLPQAEQLLLVVEEQSKQSGERATFDFLVAVEYEQLGLKSRALNIMSRAISVAVDNNNEQFAARAALWLARWGAESEPERIINALSVASLREHTHKQLAGIRAFLRQADDSSGR